MRLADIEDALTRAGDGIILHSCRIPHAMVPEGLPEAGDGLVAADLWLSGARLEAVIPPGRDGDGRPEVDMGQAMVWALPVDCHTHVDKGQTWGRAPNPDGSFAGAMAAGERLREAGFDADDLATRARFILDCALAHGTGALRSHVDVTMQTCDRAMAVMAEVAADYRGRMAVQLAPFFGLGQDPALADHAAQAACRDGVLSCFVYTAPGMQEFLDRIFGLAVRHGLALDFHADENLDPDSHCLRAIARTALRTGFDGPIVVGHACALSVQPPDAVRQTLDLVQEAGIGVISLPLCNAYLQDRGTGSPRRRGIAPLHEMTARGVPVAIASDNVRDRFHAYGDMDVVELFRLSQKLLHLDHPVGSWPAAISTTPAAMMGLPDHGRVSSGGPADLMILSARSWSEFGARPPARILLRGGRVQDTTPPDFATLDHLEGLTP